MTEPLEKQLADKSRVSLRQFTRSDITRYTAENFDKAFRTRKKHRTSKAFCTNAADPAYRQLSTHTYYRWRQIERRVSHAQRATCSTSSARTSAPGNCRPFPGSSAA